MGLYIPVMPLRAAARTLRKTTVDSAFVGDACSGASLVERIRNGDKQAEEELFNRYQRGIACILHEQGASPEVAEDLYQETATIVIQKIRKGELRQANSLSAFICSVAKNLALAHFRKSSRLSPVSTRELGIASPADQHEELVRKEEAQIVQRVISELKTERDRQIILRYYLGEEEKEDVCRDLALDSLHFNRVLHRALQRFKELFEKHSTPGNAKR